MMNEQDVQAYGTVDPTGRAALVLAPHPDDETLQCGGCIALHVRAGDAVHVVVVSDGGSAINNTADDPGYAARRRREAEAACKALGVSSVDFWNLPDRAVADDAALRERLVDAIRRHKPGVIYTPSPLELHPDHKTLAHAVWRAARDAAHPCEVWFCEVGTPLRPNALVDISAVAADKERALDCYASQQAARDYRSVNLGLARYRALAAEPGVTHAEAFWRVRAPEELAGSVGAAYAHLLQREGAFASRGGVEIAVVVRTKDRPAYLREALACLTHQWHPPQEVIVVNAGGCDVSSVLSEFEGRLAITPVDMTGDVTRPMACNAGWRAASAPYVLFFDDDDLLQPDHLMLLAEAAARGDADLVHTGFETARYERDGNGRLVEVGRERHIPDFRPDDLFFENHLAFMTVLVPRRLLEEVGGLDESMDIYEDWDLWIRLSRIAAFELVPEASCVYRLIPQAGMGGTWAGRHPAWWGRLFEKHRASIPGEAWASWYFRRVHEPRERAHAAAEELDDARRLLGSTPGKLLRGLRKAWRLLRGRGV